MSINQSNININKIDEIMDKKQTRLCFSADFTLKKDLLFWTNLVGPDICILKTHIDILEDFDESVIEELIKLKKKHNFYILEDRKFGDIGKTFQKQLMGGMYKIGTWADIITVHGICCAGMLQSIDYLGLKNIKVLIVAQMSSSCNIITSNYTRDCYNIADKYRDLVLGFITQTKFVNDDNFLFITPGVRLNNTKSLDQNYRTPKKAFEEGNDIIIVGSGIYSQPIEDYEKIIGGYKI